MCSLSPIWMFTNLSFLNESETKQNNRTLLRLRVSNALITIKTEAISMKLYIKRINYEGYSHEPRIVGNYMQLAFILTLLVFSLWNPGNWWTFDRVSPCVSTACQRWSGSCFVLRTAETGTSLSRTLRNFTRRHKEDAQILMTQRYYCTAFCYIT